MNLPSLLRPMWKAQEIETSLLTWEWISTYDRSPAPCDLLKSFETDFPLTVKRLSVCGSDPFFIPLVSFNSAEGRHYRYLVSLRWQRKSSVQRTLPRQLWLYGAADFMLRNSVGKDENGLDGCAVFYFYDGDSLFVLVFFEGRLCHWIEERGYEKSEQVNHRLAEIQNFLKVDSLFNRRNHFDLVRIDDFDCKEKKAFFIRAAKDPLWKRVNFSSLENKGWPGTIRSRKFFELSVSAIVLALILAFGIEKMNQEVTYLRDVAAPQLSAYETILAIEHEENPVLTDRLVRPRKSCGAIDLKLQGVVAGKIFLAYGRAYSVGDSIENMVVAEITKSGVRFVCGGRDFWVEVK